MQGPSRPAPEAETRSGDGWWPPSFHHEVRQAVAEKATLVSGAREAYGLAPTLRAVGLSCPTWYHHHTPDESPVRRETRA